MEDDKLQSLFSCFEPELSSDTQFMRDLERNMDLVESVKAQNAESRSRNKKAVAIAALAGFIAGFLFSLSLPYLENFIASRKIMFPDNSLTGILADNFMLAVWMMIAGASVLVALNSYRISMTLLKPKATDLH